MTNRRRLFRRLGVASIAIGTFLGLGLMLGPIGVANADVAPVTWTSIDSGSALKSAVAGVVNGGAGHFRLNASMSDAEITNGLSVASGATISVDLNGNTLTINGTDGTAGLRVNLGGQSTIFNGSLAIHGGAGSDTPLSVSHGVVNLGTLVLDTQALTITGGTGVAAHSGGLGISNGGTLILNASTAEIAGGDGGSGGDAMRNFGKWMAIAVDSAYTFDAPGGHGGSGGATDGSSFNTDTDHATLDANVNGVAPATYRVYGTGQLSTVTTMLRDLTNWPLSDSADVLGWSATRDGEVLQSDPSLSTGQTFYAQWLSTDDGNGAGTGESSAGATASSTTTDSPQTTTVTTGTTTDSSQPTTVTSTTDAHASTSQPTVTATSSAAPVTSSAPPTTKAPASTSPAVPATTPKPSAPASTSTATSTSSSTASIPTNNVKNPETFVSRQAPAPQPLPTESSVNDTSASEFNVDTHTPTQGGNLTLVAKGFKPGSVVDFWMHSTPVYLGSTIADVHGIAVLAVTLDETLVGQHHVQSVGTGLLGEPRNLAQPITIAAPPALASTGPAAAAPLTFIAVLLLAGGSALLLADRRRTLAAAHLAGSQGATHH